MSDSQRPQMSTTDVKRAIYLMDVHEMDPAEQKVRRAELMTSTYRLTPEARTYLQEYENKLRLGEL